MVHKYYPAQTISIYHPVEEAVDILFFICILRIGLGGLHSCVDNANVVKKQLY